MNETEFPVIPNLRISNDETVPYEAKVLGHVVFGEPGSGKTRSEARQFVDECVNHPYDSFFSLDASGSFTDDVIAYASIQKPETWEWLRSRIVYVRMGDPEYIVPMPEFSLAYGTTYEEQINRVVMNLSNLTGEFGNAEIVGGVAVKAVLPNILRLLTSLAHVSQHHEPFQITELQALLDDKPTLRLAVNKCGEALDAATRTFINVRLLKVKDELRTYALSEPIAAISSPTARADLGFYTPGITVKEATEKGLIVLFDGSRLINQRLYRDYKFVQIYSLIMETINQRTPHDPRNRRLNLYLDEVKILLNMKSFANEIEDMSALYRSRNLAPTVLIQAPSQLPEALERSIFLMRNVSCYAQSIKRDAELLSHQLFEYDPDVLKESAQKEVYETERGEGRQIADFLIRMPHRACFVKRHRSERDKDPYIYFVGRTKEVPPFPSRQRIEEIKDELLKKRAVRIREALQYPQERMDWLQGVERPGM